ncbi:DMT family transporter [Paractinoplanes rishiriensis]|uniref:Cation transporter n=1 Tax=Paractinoplanes rishiriensis TaxID=1050105 RepID=A0A919JXL4_9ACTN|nr:SMR family transporter [Actinoplanes rishiriensis]GIE95519.1 cation transporter [Actinoplanes rishiriensis]
MIWIYLAGAILSEVSGTLALRMAAQPGATRWWFAGVAAGYLTAFGCLGLALAGGMPVGVAYGIWAACGVALTALASRLLFREPFTGVMGLGVALIIGGVLCIELGAVH